jgi:hypothetical protein
MVIIWLIVSEIATIKIILLIPQIVFFAFIFPFVFGNTVKTTFEAKYYYAFAS